MGIAPSQYLFSAAKAGTWRNGNVFHIPYPVDTGIFTPNLREKGRARLKLDGDQRALLFIAQTIDDPRKGFEDALHVFLELSGTYKNLVFVLVGEMRHPIKSLQETKNQVRYVGKINDTRVMAEIFAGCDCHVLPTKADNFPCTIMESLSCGTPVVAYGVGGVPEMIPSNEQGRVVRPNDREKLKEEIISTIQGSVSNRQRSRISQTTAETYAVDNYIDKHEALYKTLIAANSNNDPE